MDELLMVIVVFGTLMLGIVTIVAHVMRLWRTAIYHRTLREAIKEGSEAVAPMVAEGLDPRDPPRSDGRLATILVATALALIAFGAVQGDAEDFRQMAAAAMFPMIIGAALFAREWWLARKASQGL